MRTTHLARWLGVALAASVAGGCGTSATSRFYTLGSTAGAAAASDAPASYRILVGPVSVPASVDRPEFVVQVAPNRVEIDELNRWAAPLGEGIARAVAGDLEALLGGSEVAVAPLAAFDPGYRVTINVQRFDTVVGKSVLLEAVWAVRGISDGKTRSGRTLAKETVESPDYDALAAAHSRAIGQMSGDIAAAIRQGGNGS